MLVGCGRISRYRKSTIIAQGRAVRILKTGWAPHVNMGVDNFVMRENSLRSIAVMRSIRALG
jgi:hypothetical protein